MVYSQLTSSSQKGFDLSGTCAGLSVISNVIHLGGGVNNAAISVAESKRLRARHLEKHGMTEEESQMQSFKSFLTSL